MKTAGARSVAAALAALLALVVAACGGASSSAPPPGASSTAAGKATTTAAATHRAGKLDGPTLANPAPEPPLVLRNYLGNRVNLASYRGRAVLLTFIYTHCRDVCPLIVANLHNALERLGPKAASVQVIGVSTDPKGDTRSAIGAFLAQRGMTGRMEYLVGSRRALVPVWKSWGISASNPTGEDEVAHTAVVYGITASGRIATAYAANFTPAQIAHDVPVLAGE